VPLRRRRRRASLRGLLSRLVLLLALVLAVLIVVAVVGTVNTARDYRSASQQALERQGAANGFLINMLNAQSANRAYILLARGTDLQAWTLARSSYDEEMAALLRAVADDPELLASADAVDRTARLWSQEAIELIRLRRQGRVDEAVRRVDSGPAEDRFNAFRREQVALLEGIEQQRLDDLASNDRNTALTLAGIASAALLALLMVGLISRQVWRRVGVPIDRVEDAVRRVARGVLSEPVVIDDDAVLELDDLAQGFNRMQAEVLDEREQVAAAAKRDAAQTAERRLWETVQQGLLPARLPSPPGFRLTARYRPAERALLVGGDFYDGKILPDGRLALMVGDMAGHGAASAAQAAGLRFGWRTLVSVDPDPAAVMAGLNVQMSTPELRAEGIFASVIYMLVAPDGELGFAVAGHPPPLLLTPEGCAVVEAAAKGPLLGVLDAAEWPVTQARLPVGGTMFMYTDGLVEARRDSELFGTERACAALAQEWRSPIQLRVRRLIRAARRHEDRRLRDDVVVLAVERPDFSRLGWG
jgi:serine phosphatase RsbU (regulator of sigma subunit)/CHASE3 domain sensor protein